MADQDDTALVTFVAEAMRREQSRPWHETIGEAPVIDRMAVAAIAAVRGHDRAVVSTEEASRRLAAAAVRAIATKGRGA